MWAGSGNEEQDTHAASQSEVLDREWPLAGALGKARKCLQGREETCWNIDGAEAGGSSVCPHIPSSGAHLAPGAPGPLEPPEQRQHLG